MLLTMTIVGCESSNKPEGKLIGTMSVYRTPTGSITVVNDQDGNSMAFEFHLARVLVAKKEEK